MKRTICILLIALLCVFYLSVIAEESEEQREEFTSGDYTYALLDDGTAEIIEYKGEAESLEIPAELDGKRVTRIGNEAVSNISILTSIAIPDSVTEIGANPFRYCDALTGFQVSPDHPALAVIDGVLFSKADKRLVSYPLGLDSDAYTIPQGIEIIGDGAFAACSGLISITIPDSVTRIGDDAFSGCISLTSITIPDSVTWIGDGAFSGCISLTSITIPDSVTRIGDGAFIFCSLTSIAIPDSVTEIGTNPFEYCDALTGFQVSQDHPALAVIDGVLFSKADNRLVSYPLGLESDAYTIPQGIEIIGDSAFVYCEFLTSITIPDSVTQIGEYALLHCSGLTSITIPDSVTRIGDRAFNGCDQLTLTVGRDSYAKDYCITNNLNYTYPDANDWLTN